MRVMIIGAGLAGVSLYRVLNAGGHEVRLIDRAEHFDRSGYGIVLWGGTWDSLEQLGVAGAVEQAGVAVNHWRMRGPDGQHLRTVTLESGQGGQEARWPFAIIHRADLHEALRAGLPDGVITMGTSVDAVQQDTDGVTVTLTDGSRERVDVLVGADGIHSRVRRLVFGDGGAQDLGTASWAFWVSDSVDLPDEEFTELLGHNGKEVLAGGIAGKRMATVGMPVPAEPAIRDPLAYLREHTDEWLLSSMLDALSDDDEVFFDRNRKVDIPRFDRGRVVLVGDAAHAVHPIIGMGASLALEDAPVLGEELGRADPSSALPEFTRRRRGKVAKAHRQAALAQHITMPDSAAMTAVRNFTAARTPLFEWVFSGTH